MDNIDDQDLEEMNAHLIMQCAAYKMSEELDHDDVEDLLLNDDINQKDDSVYFVSSPQSDEFQDDLNDINNDIYSSVDDLTKLTLPVKYSDNKDNSKPEVGNLRVEISSSQESPDTPLVENCDEKPNTNSNGSLEEKIFKTDLNGDEKMEHIAIDGTSEDSVNVQTNQAEEKLFAEEKNEIISYDFDSLDKQATSSSPDVSETLSNVDRNEVYEDNNGCTELTTFMKETDGDLDFPNEMVDIEYETAPVEDGEDVLFEALENCETLDRQSHSVQSDISMCDPEEELLLLDSTSPPMKTQEKESCILQSVAPMDDYDEASHILAEVETKLDVQPAVCEDHPKEPFVSTIDESLNPFPASPDINSSELPSNSDFSTESTSIYSSDQQPLEDSSNQGIYKGKASISQNYSSYFSKCLYDLNNMKVRNDISTLKEKPKEGKLAWYRKQLLSRNKLIEEMDVFISNLILKGQEIEGRLNSYLQDINGIDVSNEKENNYGYIYVEEAGLYYDPKSQYYYDPNNQLFYDPASSTYFSYDADANEYKVHSVLDQNTEEPSVEASQKHSLTDLQPCKKKKTKGKVKEKGKSPQTPNKSEISWGLDKLQTTEDPAIDSQFAIAPCLRLVIEEEDDPKLRFHFVTIDGGFIGRSDENSVCLNHPCVNKVHAEITYKSESSSDHHYYVRDLGSTTGTFVNSQRLSNSCETSEEVEIGHMWNLTVGDITMKCHLHPGNLTCNSCDISRLSSLNRSSSPLKKTVQLSAELERRRQLKLLRKKYDLSFHEDMAFLTREPSTYLNRAKDRRATKGSINPYEKTQAASVNMKIPKENKGFMMLKKMGWSEGGGLGKNLGGRTEPVLAEGTVGFSGLGAGSLTHEPQVKESALSALKRDARRHIMNVTQRRYEQAGLILENPAADNKTKGAAFR